MKYQLNTNEEDNTLDIPNEINPFEILKINPNSPIKDCKKSFRKLIINNDINIKRIASLAYDMISCEFNYIKKGNIYQVVNKDHFYYTIIGDLKNLKKLYKENKNILKEKDLLGRSLLYISARNGFTDICQFLLEEGIDPNDFQSTDSTPLHGASFYNQYDTVKLLLEYGAKTTIKNMFGKSVYEEANSDIIKNIILNSQKDKITCLLNKLTDEKLANRLILVKYNNLIIGKKILRNEEKIGKDIDLNYIKNNWEVGWHGTKFEFLESIMKYGLYPSGSKLENGVEIKPLEGHVKLNTKVAGFDDWARAIFVSPSIFYAGPPVYARKIISNDIQYSTLIETRIKPGTFSKHPPTVVQYAQKNGEPTFVEYRIEVKDDSNLIMRIESEKNVIVTGVLFAKTEFLENIKDYYQGEIFVNSKEEHNLFLT